MFQTEFRFVEIIGVNATKKAVSSFTFNPLPKLRFAFYQTHTSFDILPVPINIWHVPVNK
jgi:hypothetical protein